MADRDKARDDKFVNFQEEHEMRYIARLYKNLDWEYLQDMELGIKAYHDKTRRQPVTHEEVYEYLEEKKGYERY